jgi:hypothetical protein
VISEIFVTRIVLVEVKRVEFGILLVASLLLAEKERSGAIL